LKEVEASGAGTLGRDRAGTKREARDIGIGEARGRRSRLSRGEEQAARKGLARALTTFYDDASMRARIATDARLLGITQD